MKFSKTLCAVAVAGIFAMEVNVAEAGWGDRKERGGQKPRLTIGRGAPANPANSASPQTSVRPKNKYPQVPQVRIDDAITATLGESADRFYFEYLLFAKDDMQQLMDFFKNRTAEESLGLEFVNCEISKDGMKVLLDGLKKDLPIKFLILMDITMTSGNIKTLSEALETNKNLKGLTLRNVEIARKDFTIISEALNKNETLEWLYFGPGDISFEDLIEFSKKIHIGLCRYLNDSGPERIELVRDGKPLNICDVTDDIIHSVLDQILALDLDRELEDLDFKNCAISGETVELLRKFKSLKGVGFRNCEIISSKDSKVLKAKDGTITPEGLFIISEALNKNETLKWLYFGPRDISFKDMIELSKETHIGLLRYLNDFGPERIMLAKNGKELHIGDMTDAIVQSFLKQMLDLDEKLESLAFARCTISDGTVSLLKKYKFNLVEFKGCEIVSSKDSKVLKAKDETITQEGLSIISEALKNTKWLGFGSNDISLEDLIKFSKKTHIGLSQYINAYGPECINLRLDGKQLNFCDATDDTIQPVLKKMLDRELEFLGFKNCTISDKTVSLLSGYRFTGIEFKGCKITDGVLSGLLRTLETEELRLIDGTITPEGLSTVSGALKENKTLKLLSLECNNLSFLDIGPLTGVLKENKFLESLSIAGNPLEKLGVKTLFSAIARNSTLKKFWIYDVGVAEGDRGEVMESLKGRKEPLNIWWKESLYLFGEKPGSPMVVGGPQRAEASEAKTTSDQSEKPEVDVRRVFKDIIISEEDIKRIPETLQALVFEGCTLSNTTMKLIGELLKSSKSLKEVAFSGCKGITSLGAGYFSKALKKNECLEVLCLDNGSIDGDVLDVISGGLAENHGIKQLFLNANDLKTDDILPLADALEGNETLEVLNISRNGEIKRRGISSLFGGIPEDPHLKKIYVIDVGVTKQEQTILMNLLPETVEVVWE